MVPDHGVEEIFYQQKKLCLVIQSEIFWNFLKSEGKFLVATYKFGGSFGMSLKGDCDEVEVTPNLELLVNFGMSLEGVCHELYTWFHYKFISNLEQLKILM